MAQIKITLPNPTDRSNIATFLKQLELCVHHAKKSYETELSLREDQKEREDDAVWFETSLLDEAIEAEAAKAQPLKDISSNFFDEHQEVTLVINIV